LNRVTIIDGWCSAEDVAEADAAWPFHGAGWYWYDDDRQRKATLANWKAFAPVHCRLLSRMGREFAAGSVPDFDLWGAGLCEMGEGDFLAEHLDHETHPHLGLRRTHNAILFLGGDGPLIVGRGDAAVSVEPVAGRVCLFDTTPESFHRVGPVKGKRRSLSVYFYDGAEWRDPATAGRTRAEFTSAT
jgi:hypothetical protein